MHVAVEDFVALLGHFANPPDGGNIICRCGTVNLVQRASLRKFIDSTQLWAGVSARAIGEMYKA
jgi:hypothetical protein